ncbi:glycosyltransferase family 4 protein [Mucilaginibacter glaciei]|uniref:Glycosyltransferase family 4 protein n=1 Tax=Mucilaginibacter glaciei TaxID=2772109 RepID=A0A926S518_9SPHI|nr:glycosyltransferase family 1 protein [Mucilaginibacter glaciei]MBD1392306.1 glycosyltransferase family 4 protein [Mucilaginibacter glaciei]
MPKTLTIGVDIRDLQTAQTGTKTYLEEICKAFKKMDLPDVRFYFIDTCIPVYTGKNRLLSLAEHLRFQLWKQLILPLKASLKGCDIVFCTDTVVPFVHFGYKTIPVFHDAFFFENPQHYGKMWLWLYLKTAMPAARRSPFIVTPSLYARQQINQYTHIPLNKLVVVAEGPKEKKPNENSLKLLTQFGLFKSNYILHVGSMFKRKNIPALINAFGKLKQDGYPNLKLVLAGSSSPSGTESDHLPILNAIKENKLDRDVILTGYITDEQVGTLYSNASIYVFPSLNEGFGIPVLEAFQYNLPVLVSDNTSLPEVGGDAVLLFDPKNLDDIYDKMRKVLDNPILRQNMIDKGRARLAQFSWQKAAVELVKLFKNAV